MSKPLNILVIHLEFTKWKIAKNWSFHAQLGLSGGFRSNNIEVLEVLNPYGGLSFKKVFGEFVRKLIGSKKFDQVWMEVVHSNYDNDFMSFIKELAPVRVAMLGESMQYTQEDCFFAPVLSGRYEQVKNKLQYFTHALTVDEADAKLIESDCGLKTLWWVLGMPECSIATTINESEYDKAIFSGPAYGNRSRFLQHPELSKYMLHLPPLERKTTYPFLFDYRQILYMSSLLLLPSLSVHYNQEYVETIRNTRSKLFESWLKGLNRGFAVVQLPHFVKALPGRIYEGMAAGKPVITMSLKNRPRTMQLFEPGKEILYYNDSPEELTEILKRLQKDKSYGKQIAENAINKLRELHTIEIRIKQILHWIETGNEPEYL